MKLIYYPETDSLYIEFNAVPSVETREIIDNLNADFDSSGRIVGLDIDHASKSIDLSILETKDLPLRSLQAANSDECR